MRIKYIYLFLILLILGTGCSHQQSTAPEPFGLKEVSVQRIPLAGDAADRNSEISGLAWYKDYLILIPQYPNIFENKVFAIPKVELLSFISGEKLGAIEPIEIQLKAPGLMEKIEGFEGLEAIAFDGEKVFLTIEASPNKMKAYLIAGEIQPDLEFITLDTENIVEIPIQSDIPNASEETIFLAENRIYTIYEGNGKNVNPNPVAHSFDFQLNPLEPVPFPNIEYRITDATDLDEDNRFWGINYFWPGEAESYNPATDEIAKIYGEGETHSKREGVERLVEFQYSEDGITLSERLPILIELMPDDLRNWEGIVRLEDFGFLIVTDKFPETILGFVKYK